MPSTVLADMACDRETRTLSVWFRPSGRRHDYFEVPAVAYDALRHSSARGRYFNAHIRDGTEFAQSDRSAPRPRLRHPAGAHFSDRS